MDAACPGTGSLECWSAELGRRFVEDPEQSGAALVLTGQDADAAAPRQQLSGLTAGPRAGQQLRWQQRVGFDALVEPDRDVEGAGKEVVLGQLSPRRRIARGVSGTSR